MFKARAWAACSLALLASAASFSPKPEGITVVKSNKFPGVSISYKQTCICETTHGVKGYSGHVNLPRTESRNYESHMYFWFFEARHDAAKAPLTMWLSGGPGVPSSNAALNENGPCNVLEDSKTTQLNPWSWNEKVNMLYIDQPVQVGYSYDTLVNGTIDLVDSPFAYKPANFSTGVPETNLTFLTGTFASQKLANAPNTSVAAAPFIYEFMQTWMQEFPPYKPHTNNFSIWGQSYAGHYAPVIAAHFSTQNALIAASNKNSSAIPLHVETLGLVNACIDIDTQMPYYPKYAINNTYGIRAINQSQYDAAMAAEPMCKNMTATCRSLAANKDPRSIGNNADVNKACKGAFDYCFKNMHSAYTLSGRNVFDVTSPAYPQAFPPKWAAGYLNSADVQRDLGVGLNWTGQSVPVAVGFDTTGDFPLVRGVPILRSLLAHGTKVALVYGDQDYQCNWLGGEAVSLAIASAGFEGAGYADIHTNASYVGGVVRQVGGLSFSRVFQAGHAAPYYQPQTAQQIFNRVMFDTDVSTGTVASHNYTSSGPKTAWSVSEPLAYNKTAQCYVWDVLETCTPEEGIVLRSGRAVTRDFVLLGNGTVG
ncbi:alpha/beta-hydrolase [Ophiobolus disseminans]|uniref:Alpha/beta-hydrolase n=1 Tax=Ophiobolus disseminans TaxID=1469910 RepID=A0A6A7AJ82_9PLEO|nr:alpha/beta-hydrolase [Ophiobolus disseminans]